MKAAVLLLFQTTAGYPPEGVVRVLPHTALSHQHLQQGQAPICHDPLHSWAAPHTVRAPGHPSGRVNISNENHKMRARLLQKPVIQSRQKGTQHWMLC